MKIRIKFRKYGTMKFIGHLDVIVQKYVITANLGEHKTTKNYHKSCNVTSYKAE